MIQDILPKKYNNAYYPDKKPDDNSICFVFNGSLVLAAHEETCEKKDIPEESCSIYEMNIPAGDVIYPTYARLKKNVEKYQYLFAIDNDEFYLVKLSDDANQELIDEKDVFGGFKYENYKAHRHASPKDRVFAMMTAYHLYCWYSNNVFCGKCGAKTIHHPSLRALKCPECANMIFPRISPAIIVGVHDGERILMTKYNGRDYKGYALVAGFIEIGESVEDTVRREVLEEVGVNVRDITYYKTQPWGMDGGLLIGYFATLDGNPEITLDEDELSMARWYTRDEITVQDDDISLTSNMIDFWKNEWKA